MVGESAHVAVITRLDSVGVSLAEFALVLLRVVKVFDSVMSARATFTVLAVVRLRTEFRSVKAGRSAPIFLIRLVVVEALFGVVSKLVFARLSLERHQI